MPQPLLVLVTGPAGAGKSVLSRLLAQKTGCPLRVVGAETAHARTGRDWRPLTMPAFEVDTTDGYAPGLPEILKLLFR